MSAEPPDSPPIWWTCENECWKCWTKDCPRRSDAGPEEYREARGEEE
jgi:hypothetical protein